MSSRKRKRREQTDRASQETAPCRTTEPPRQGVRYLMLAGLATGAAALVIAVVVVLTPHDGQHDVVPPRDTPASIARPQSALAVRSVRSELVLPQSAADIEVEPLQRELSELATKLVAQYPEDADALFVAGMVCSLLQQSERAVELLRQCIRRYPKHPEAYVGLAENLKLIGRGGEAVEVLRLAVARGKASGQVTRGLADALASNGQLEEAAHVLKEGTTRFPDDSQLWLQRGQMQVELQRYEEAESSIRKAMQLGERGVPPLVALSTCLARQHKQAQALQVRKQLAALSAEQSTPASSSSGKFQAELEALLRREAVQVLYDAAHVYSERGEWPSAKALLMRSIALDPQKIQNYLLLTSVYRAEGRLPDAVCVLERLITLQPDNIVHYTNFASIATQFGDHAQAERTLKQAVARDLESGVAHWALGILYLSQGRAADALEFAQVAAQRMQNMDAYLLLISAYQAVGDDVAARQTYQQAKQLDPDDPRLLSIRN